MIRRAKEQDVWAIFRIEKDVFPSPLDLKFLIQELSDNPYAVYFVLEENQSIVAYLGFRVVDEQAEMMNFAVLKDYQSQGLGTRLLTQCLKELAQMGVKMLSLEVRRSNHKAQHLYEKEGFVKSHIRKEYYPNEDAFVYVKEVNASDYLSR